EKSIQKQEEEEAVQSKEDKEDVQTKSEGQSNNSRSVESKLSSHRGGGHTMDAGTQSSMEQAFSNDFSNVKIHTGSYAQEMNQNLKARAFTNGNDIYFNSGEYNPGSKEGKHLLAHELTHTIQQKGATDKVNKQAQPNAQQQCVPGSVLTRARSTLYFNQDTTNLRGDSALHLVQLINEVNQYMTASGGSGNLLIHGYASEEGSATHNQTLSQNRANYVKSLLAASGVPGGRMIPVGHGEDVSRPTLENNRRVEVTYVPPVTCDPCRLTCNGVPRLLETRARNYGSGPDWTTAPQPVGGARGLAVNTMDFLKSDLELQNIMNIELGLLAGGLGRAMTAHFRGGSRATVRHNPGTPLEVLTHRSSSARTYFNTVEAQLATQLHIMKTLGNIDCNLFNITGIPHLHFPITSMGDPAPLRAIIGGTQGHELYITGMRALGNTFPCAYQVDVKLILFDDFGVDTSDLYSPSLMAFWILQHRRRGNRPFINRIETNRSFIL
ncbi:MAG: DUF4157 domain-containing protein, partial [Saprospiraceae bacterium]|nr:DUF4157 domain-containing protein [Saprospiraceae bacterium]